MPPKSTLAKNFTGKLCYKEANETTGYVYMGRADHLAPYHSDVLKFRDRSKFYGCVLCPEMYDGEEWTYEHNKAFIAGAIEARRSFIIVSDLDTASAPLRNGYTADELFWLKDNGYTFKPNPSNSLQTLAEPPMDRTCPTFICNYHEETEPPRKSSRKNVMRVVWDGRKERFECIRTQVLNQRELFLTVTSRAPAPAASASAPELRASASTTDVVSALSPNPASAAVPIPKPDIPIPSTATSEPEPKDKPKPPSIDPSIPQQPPPP